MSDETGATERPISRLQRFTSARVVLGRVGDSLPTREHLRFQLDHARARDAVYSVLETARLRSELKAHGFPVVAVRSAAADRRTYLQRPDLGRQLDEDSQERLATMAGGYDALFVVADGLSASAVNRNALPLIVRSAAYLAESRLRLGPVIVAEQGRVALGDPCAQLLGADLVIVLIGERPGLSSPESMGVYLTWRPHPGTTDADRNCISNVRAGGLRCEEASARLLYLVAEARRRRLSGVALKEAAQRTADLEAIDPPGLIADQ